VNNIKLILDFPVTVNQYWFTFSRKNSKFATMAVSKKGLAYRSYIKQVVIDNNLNGRYVNGELLSVLIKLFPKDRRKRDIDNYTKGLFDALSKAGNEKLGLPGFWTDDSQVKHLNIEMKEIYKGGKIEMEIIQIGQEQVQKQGNLKLVDPPPF